MSPTFTSWRVIYSGVDARAWLLGEQVECHVADAVRCLLFYNIEARHHGIGRSTH